MAPKARAKPRSRARAGSLRERLSALVPNRAWLDPWLVVAALALLLCELEAYVWLGALLGELRLQLALLHALGAAAALAWKRFPRGALLLVCALLWCAPLWPYVRAARPTPQHGPALELVQQHLASAALTPATLGRFLASERPDVLSLTGLRPRAAAALMRGASGYRQLALRDATEDLLLARSELIAAQPGKAALRVGRCNVELSQVQLPSLFDARAQSVRQGAITKLTRAQLGARHVLIGHFGSRSEAADLQALIETQALRDARLGHGLLASAPAALGALGLPVDQLLLRGWLLVRDAAALPPITVGAHRALAVTLELTEPRCAVSTAR